MRLQATAPQPNCRFLWERSIAQMDRPRWSITFRSPSELWIARWARPSLRAISPAQRHAVRAP